MKCLAPCPSCDRHIAIDEAACPFCATALPKSFRREHACGRPPPGRLSRAAMIAAGATLIGVQASCGTASSYGTSPAPDSGAVDAGASDNDAAAAPTPRKE
jgi:hypothetical protein